jgi:hypothetical protein
VRQGQYRALCQNIRETTNPRPSRLAGNETSLGRPDQPRRNMVIRDYEGITMEGRAGQ